MVNESSLIDFALLKGRVLCDHDLVLLPSKLVHAKPAMGMLFLRPHVGV